MADAVCLLRLAEDFIEEDDVLEGGEAAFDIVDERPELAGGEEGAGLGIVEDVGDFTLLEARVDRDDLDPGAGEAEVDDHPLGAVLHHEGDALAGLDPELPDGLGDGAGLLEVVAVGPGAPDPSGLPAQGDAVAAMRGGVEKNGAEG